MSSTLLASLYYEESTLLSELRASTQFRRLEEIQRLITLYAAAPPVGADLDAVLSQAQASVMPSWAGTQAILQDLGAGMRRAEVA
jgi:hypothetical protein